MHIDVDSACALTDAAFLAICRNCPSIEYISIAKNNKGKGHIGGEALATLKADKTLAKELRVPNLVDQYSIKSKAAETLSKTRKNLAISEGDTNKWAMGSISLYGC